MATKEAKKNKYYEAVGRRKTAVARVRLFPEGKEGYAVNETDLQTYFPTSELQEIATEALKQDGVDQTFYVSVKVQGGGVHAQAEAVRHGIARALTVYNEELRKGLKKEGFLKRDPRSKERKKFGLRKARRAPQWSKR